MSPLRRVALLVIVLVLVPIVSCGTRAGSSPDPTPSNTGDTSTKRAKARSKAAVLDAGALPGKWEPEPVRQHIGNPGVPEYCGVTMRPKPLRAQRVDLYARRSTGPFIAQYTYVTERRVAVSKLNRLAKAAKGCTSERSGGTKYKVRPIRHTGHLGDARVGLHYTASNGIPSEALIFRHDEVIVVLLGYGPPVPPFRITRAVGAGVDRQLD